VFIYPDPNGIGAGEGGKWKGQGAGGWLIEVDANEVERLAKHIKRYRLRAKFEVRVLEVGERGVWSLWDDGLAAESNSSSSTSASSPTDGEAGLGCLDTRAPGMGRRLLLPGGKKPEVQMDESIEDAYQIRRYLNGVPEGQDELIREHALPQESNIDFMGGIDYRKGCYVGQELTIRTHHTGVIRKRVLPVMIYGIEESMPEVLEYRSGELDGSVIPRETSIGRVEKSGRSAGKWLKGVGNVGLGLCRLEIMTGSQVGGEVGGWKESDEFKLEWQVEGAGEEMVKVKAFVPSWHLKK
jgi:folate-binding protein YgfZ